MIGLNLVRFRKLAGMTQNDIANILQIKRQTYSAYERDVSVPDAYTLAKISDVYQVSVDRLLGRQEQNPSSCRIPVLGHIQAGYPNLSAEDVIDFEEISQELAETGEYFALSVSGNSMEPRICEGDIVIIDSSYKLAPFTADTNTEKDQRLLINAESAQWFRDHKVKAVGFGDGVSIENCNEDVKPFHDILMAENIVFLEVLKNLEELKTDVFFMSYSPLPIKGLDSSPVRAYAIEGLTEFSE